MHNWEAEVLMTSYLESSGVMVRIDLSGYNGWGWVS